MKPARRCRCRGCRSDQRRRAYRPALSVSGGQPPRHVRMPPQTRSRLLPRRSACRPSGSTSTSAPACPSVRIVDRRATARSTSGSSLPCRRAAAPALARPTEVPAPSLQSPTPAANPRVEPPQPNRCPGPPVAEPANPRRWGTDADQLQIVQHRHWGQTQLGRFRRRRWCPGSVPATMSTQTVYRLDHLDPLGRVAR